MKKTHLRFFQIEFPEYADSRGSLVPIELIEKIPFFVQRVYFLQNVPEGISRGSHCHHQEEEVFVCIRGKCRALIDKDGEGKEEILLNERTKGIYVGKQVWHEFDSFSPNALLLAFSSTVYFPGKENYEYDYESFKKIVEKNDF
jgi:dTDP-4-dehydrorhamnose 3,5-epimerase-like enzyme